MSHVLRVVNPATGEIVSEHPEHTPAQAAASVEDAARAQQRWRRESFAHRGAIVGRAGARLTARREELARLMAVEMGKPLKQGRAEIDKCAHACGYLAEHAEELLRPELIPTDARKSALAFQPLGVVLAVMPWNFPFWQVFRFAAPALMAGNTGALKHASSVPGCALAIESIFREAGLPEGLFPTLLVGAAQVEALIKHPRIAAVTLTGSTAAGKAVARLAGGELKKCVLELGGSDAYVILEDADIPTAAEICAAARLMNGGQSCIAAKRFVVLAPVVEAFTAALADALGRRKLGDPLDEATDLGPLARLDLRADLQRQVEASVRVGARLALGGAPSPGPGAYYPASVLTDVPRGCPARDDELFGPVAAIIPAGSEAEAIDIANESAYGLGAAVFTRDLARGERIATQELEAGLCFVNAFVRSDPRLPFGGIKQSGFGRELHAIGIREFVNQKTVWVG
jgi:succinate-semialdehyde dehydrogenase / glutarate-semialdehyde dehydrogenase